MKTNRILITGLSAAAGLMALCSTAHATFGGSFSLYACNDSGTGGPFGDNIVVTHSGNSVDFNLSSSFLGQIGISVFGDADIAVGHLHFYMSGGDEHLTWTPNATLSLTGLEYNPGPSQA